MINYNNRDLRCIFFRLGGSVLFSRYVLVPATVSTAFCALILWKRATHQYMCIANTVAQIYATIIGFVIVFRTTLAFGRFFEGVTHIQAMFSKWRDAFVAIVVFFETSILKHSEAPDSEEKRRVINALLVSKARILHWVSLLCALAVHSIHTSRLEEVLPAGAHLPSCEREPCDRLSHENLAEVLTTKGRRDSSTSDKTSRSRSVNQSGPSKESYWPMERKVQILGAVTPQEMEQITHPSNQ